MADGKAKVGKAAWYHPSATRGGSGHNRPHGRQSVPKPEGIAGGIATAEAGHHRSIECRRRDRGAGDAKGLAAGGHPRR
jgi:hypothetical protein